MSRSAAVLTPGAAEWGPLERATRRAPVVVRHTLTRTRSPGDQSSGAALGGPAPPRRRTYSPPPHLHAAR
jgi:hypothetical protein